MITANAIVCRRVENGWTMSADTGGGPESGPIFVAKSVDDIVALVIEWAKASRAAATAAGKHAALEEWMAGHAKPADAQAPGPVVGEVE